MTATIPVGLSLAEFNALDEPAAAELVATWARIPAWSATVAAARPYPDRDRLLDTALETSRAWTWPEVEQALATHPRLGERPPGAGSEADHSRREQSGVGEDDRAAFAAANRAYEERFGRVLLIRAAGRSGAELLAIARSRLGNDEATERAATTEQLREIALARLREAVR